MSKPICDKCDTDRYVVRIKEVNWGLAVPVLTQALGVLVSAYLKINPSLNSAKAGYVSRPEFMKFTDYQILRRGWYCNKCNVYLLGDE